MFKKWDIVFTSRFPDMVQCSRCRRHFSIVKHECDYCHKVNHVSNFVAKARPVIVWIDQTNWYESMAFGIPLSTTKYLNDKCNHMVLLEHYSFSHTDETHHKPMRAIIHQSTRIDGNVLHSDRIIGTITDVLVKTGIENKLLEWIFGSENKPETSSAVFLN